MLVVLSLFSTCFFYSLSKMLSRHVWLLLGCLCASHSVSAQTFSLPATSSTGFYTITWSGAGTYGVIDELRADGSYVSSPAGGSASGSVAISRPNGTYYYRLRTCVVAGGPPVCTNSAAKSIVVTIPAATATASFTPTAVAPGGNATLSWSSTNAANCSGSGVTISGTSGSVVYTVPANYSNDKVQVAITCYVSGPGAPATAAPILRVTVPTTYTYDEIGRVKSVRTPNGVTNTYNYDAADNRTQKQSTQN